MSDNKPHNNASRPLEYAGIAKPVHAHQGPVVRERSWPGKVSEEIAWMFVAALVLALIAGAIMFGAQLAGWIGGILAVLTTAVIGTAISSMLERTWDARAERTIELVAQAVRSGMPLPEFLLTAAQSESPGQSKSLRFIVDLLNRGVGLSPAFHAAFPRAPGWVGDALDVPPGRSMEPAVAQLQARLVRQRSMQLLRIEGYHWRFVLTLAAILGITFMLAVFVLPSFWKILSDFRTTSPWLDTLSTSPFAAPLRSPVALLLVPLLVLAFIYSIVSRLARSRPRRHELLDLGVARWLREVRDRSTWHVPFLGTHARDIAWGAFFDKLAGQVSEASPLASSAAVASLATDNSVARSRAGAFASELVTGASVVDAAKTARLPDVAVGLLGTATHAGQIESVCRLVSDRFSERAIRRAELVHAIVPILLTLLLAGLAMLVVLTVFLPMMDILNGTFPKGLGGMP